MIYGRLLFITFILSISFSPLQAQDKDNVLHRLLKGNDSLFKAVLDRPIDHKVQIIYTKIDRDKRNKPSFTTYTYNLDDSLYFYPASTVKLPASILALEKLNRLHIKGLNKYTTMIMDSAWERQTRVLYDSTSENKLPSIAHYIKKILLVSDNDAHNRLFEFMGQKYFNDELWKKGFIKTKMYTRLAVGFSREQNKHTNPVTFMDGDKVIYRQEAQYNETDMKNEIYRLKQGKGRLDSRDSLIMEPMDFTYNNYYPLSEQHELIKRLMFPEAYAKEKRYQITDDDYSFLYKYMSMLPRESKYPAYTDTTEFYDAYVKYFVFGDSKGKLDGKVRVFNKVGLSYGYLIDNAYICDFDNKVEFILSAFIHSNSDDIFNDNKYEYDQIGFPFLANLGRVVYKYELNRERKYKPDLSRFKFDYTK